MPIESVEILDGSVDLLLRDDVARQAKGSDSWADVARRSGLQPNSISHLLSGKVRLSDVRLGTVARLCAALKVDLGELLMVTAVPNRTRVQTERPITADEFAAAVQEILDRRLPADWIGPAEADLNEVGASDFGERLRRAGAALSAQERPSGR